MADPADRAQQDTEAYEASHQARFQGEPYKIPKGTPGECDECGGTQPASSERGVPTLHR